MRITSLAPLLAAGALTSAATADFQGLVVVATEEVPGPGGVIGLNICDVYACFDDDSDRLVGVFGKLRTSTDDKFWQFPALDEETAPAGRLLRLVPHLANDTLVTIGVMHTDEAPSGVDGTTLGESYMNLGNEIQGNWFLSDPDSGQGDAVNYTAGCVLIARLSVEENISGEFTEGIVTVYWQGDSTGGEVVASHDSFQHSLAPGPPGPDLDDDGDVDAADLAILLGAWGPCPASCWADLDLDGVVNAADLAILLGAWTG